MALTTVRPEGMGFDTGRRNLVHNGAMQVSQRGTSFSYAHDGTTNAHNLDRYNFHFVSSENFDCTVAQVSDGPDGFSNSLKITTGTAESAVAADEYYALFQGIEAQNLQSLGYGTSSAKTTTLSFYVKSSLTGTFGVSLYQADDARIISKTYTINSANTWERKTINIVGDTTGVIDNDNGGGIYIYWNFGTGSNYDSGTTATTWTSYTTSNFQDSSSSDALVTTAGATWQITGVQLELGEQATPFEHRSFGEELESCKRYFQKVDDVWFNANRFGDSNWDGHIPAGHHEFHPEMRAAPSTSNLDVDGWLDGDSTWSSTSTGAASPTGMTSKKVNFTGVWNWTTGYNSTHGWRIYTAEYDAEL